MPGPFSPTRALRESDGSVRRQVLFVAPQLPYPPDWGFATRVYQVVRRLAARHDVTLVALSGDRDAEALAALSRFCTVHTVEAALPTGHKKRSAQLASLLSRHSFQQRSHASPAMQQFLDELLGKELFDVIQVESSQLGLLRFNSDAVLVVDEHNIEYELLYRMFRTEESPVRKLFNGLESIKFRREEIEVWRRCAACLTTSEREESIVRSQVAEVDTAVIPNGVDLDYFVPSDAIPDSDAVVFTGAINYRPNADAVSFFAEQVLPLVHKRRPGTKLMVVGPYEPAEMKRHAGPYVTLTGRVPDIRPYIAGAAVAVAPLRMGSGTRLKVLEALAMEKPMVTTSIGCEGINVADGDHVLIADDAASFANSVVRLLDDAEFARQLGRRGRQLVDAEYGWPAIVARLDRFHSDLTDRKSRRTVHSQT